MNGFVNIFKPSGMTSAFCVWLVKKKFNLPCGHMGTLDPMASGVLPVGVGQASRLFGYLLDKEKTYKATFTFGYETDTLDATGKVIKSGARLPSLEEIKSVLPKFIGEIEQVPPKYSAKCVNGKRGYELARAGKDFELQPKKVVISNITAEKTDDSANFNFTIVCKGGTYIRSLCRDIAYELSSLATMTVLERTAVGLFTIENSVNVDLLKDENNPEMLLLPSDSVINFEKLILTKLQAKRALDGLYDSYRVKDGFYRVYNESEFWGVGLVENGILKIKTYVRG